MRQVRRVEELLAPGEESNITNYAIVFKEVNEAALGDVIVQEHQPTKNEDGLVQAVVLIQRQKQLQSDPAASSKETKSPFPKWPNCQPKRN